MKIIVGLGNPGKKYENTRHNVGQAVVSYFQEIDNFPRFQLKKRWKSLISEGKIGEEKIILVLPQTFMNESGRAVKKIILNLKSQILNLLVIHDDIDLPLGKIRIRKDGSSGGHHGVQSIIDHLKTEGFIRLKIGVANEKHDLIPAEKFVLERFKLNEQGKLLKVIDLALTVLKNTITNSSTKEQTFSL